MLQKMETRPITRGFASAPLQVLVAHRQGESATSSLTRALHAAGSLEIAATVTSAPDALEVAQQLAPDIAIIDLELSPYCSLVTALHRLCPSTRIIVMADRLRAEASRLVEALAAGAVGAVYEEASPDEMKRALAATSSTTRVVAEEAANLLLDSYLTGLAQEKERSLATIEALATALEVRDACTGEHVQRVSRLAEACLALVDTGLAMDDEIRSGFLLHDVGKIGVPDSILNKPGPLDHAEWEIMRTHPEIGVRIIEPIGFSSTTTDIVLHHHERWDGKGYPYGLTGKDIPIAARAFAVVDALDAMTSDRPYRSAMRTEDALTILKHEAGKAYDPIMVDAVTKVAA
jgi:response regulator RpfG family c-di-GMP phosphodiesterase